MGTSTSNRHQYPDTPSGELRASRDHWNDKLTGQGHQMTWTKEPYAYAGECLNCSGSVTVGPSYTSSRHKDIRDKTCDRGYRWITETLVVLAEHRPAVRDEVDGLRVVVAAGLISTWTVEVDYIQGAALPYVISTRHVDRMNGNTGLLQGSVALPRMVRSVVADIMAEDREQLIKMNQALQD
jgi:hypothetical protein